MDPDFAATYALAAVVVGLAAAALVHRLLAPALGTKGRASYVRWWAAWGCASAVFPAAPRVIFDFSGDVIVVQAIVVGIFTGLGALIGYVRFNYLSKTPKSPPVYVAAKLERRIEHRKFGIYYYTYEPIPEDAPQSPNP